MDATENCLQILIDEQELRFPHGIIVLKLSTRNVYVICIWSGSKICTYEVSPLSNGRELPELHSSNQKLNKIELNASNTVIGVLYFGGDCIYILDVGGIIYSFHQVTYNRDSSRDFMDVEDIFSSPTTSDNSGISKENIVMKIKNCDSVYSFCQFTSGFVILGTIDGQLVVQVYSFPQFSLIFVLNLQKQNAKGGVLASCPIKSLSPLLKQHFQENLDVFDTDIIVIGLTSGLVLWFCANTPLKGPFVLFSTNQNIQRIHWVEDAVSELHKNMLILLCSGQVMIYGEQRLTTVHLPDSIKSSCCLRNYIFTSNTVECYVTDMQLKKDATLNSTSLPIKGICALTVVPELDNFLIAVSVHGTVYAVNPTTTPSGNPSQFVMPGQNILDTMNIHAQSLESISKLLQEEDDIVKAVSVATVANEISHLFQSTVKVKSDNTFSVMVKLTKGGISFLHEIWLACIEVFGKDMVAENSFFKLKQDFTSDNDLIINGNQSVSIGSVVTVQLVALLKDQQPSLTVAVTKIEIDACHLMTSHTMVLSEERSQETFSQMLSVFNDKSPKHKLEECKLIIILPKDQNTTLCLATILKDSQHNFSTEEWNKISGGKKNSIQLAVNNFSTILNLSLEQRELTITCHNPLLCHKVKEAINRRLANTNEKYISEDVVLDIQAIYQSFEIEDLKDEPDFQEIKCLRNKLRMMISPNVQ